MKNIDWKSIFKRTANFICFALSLIFLIYNISIVGFFYLLVTFGETQGTMIYSLISVAGILLVIIPLVFKLAKYKFYYFALIGLHFMAALLPIVMKNMSSVFGKIL
ncbi:MAG: hypothetical protein U9Q88_11100 [Bacillota bacterium]|jgi:hypothetical protein|uniref:hypothetical protein n=1 Tax=Bacillus sp. RO2 TaxID=2723913 RepID=UPI00145D6799|nr:hypothetical protein [Bacillus sp. RO2]MEA3320567.1 hypothetical protein [Bacillota bacterium]NMH75156.1 hypothetical protein [Bacillus sp. RO2]